MATPRLHINVIPSYQLVKAHYINSGQFLTKFSTSMLIDTQDFDTLTPQQRQLIIALFLSNDEILNTATLDVVVEDKQHMTTTKGIVTAVIFQLQQANVDEQEGARQQRLVDYSIWQDGGEDPPF